MLSIIPSCQLYLYFLILFRHLASKLDFPRTNVNVSVNSFPKKTSNKKRRLIVKLPTTKIIFDSTSPALPSIDQRRS